MPQMPPAKRSRKADSTTHHEPYPDRIHRHLAAAVDAAAATAAPLTADEGQPTPAALLAAYGGLGEANTSQSEGGENDGRTESGKS